MEARDPGTTTTVTTSHGRLKAFGNQLIDVHLWLREELDALRDRLDGGPGGTGALAEPVRGFATCGPTAWPSAPPSTATTPVRTGPRSPGWPRSTPSRAPS